MSETRYVLRGGSFYLREYIRSTFRVKNLPHRRIDVYGFRVVANMKRRRVRGGSWSFDHRLSRRQVVRGGSFHLNWRLARSTCRFKLNPHSRNVYFGFRVVVREKSG